MKWSVETPNSFCEHANFIDDCVHEYCDQLECQTLCEADSGCVGIAWNFAVGTCYLCQDDILSDDSHNGFYRKPLGNNEVHSKC